VPGRRRLHREKKPAESIRSRGVKKGKGATATFGWYATRDRTRARKAAVRKREKPQGVNNEEGKKTRTSGARKWARRLFVVLSRRIVRHGEEIREGKRLRGKGDTPRFTSLQNSQQNDFPQDALLGLKKVVCIAVARSVWGEGEWRLWGK